MSGAARPMTKLPSCRWNTWPSVPPSSCSSHMLAKASRLLLGACRVKAATAWAGRRPYGAHSMPRVQGGQEANPGGWRRHPEYLGVWVQIWLLERVAVRESRKGFLARLTSGQLQCTSRQESTCIMCRIHLGTCCLADIQAQAFGGGSQNDKRTIESIKSGILNTSTVLPQVLAHRSCVEAAPWRVSAGKTWSGARREPRRACMPSPGPAASVNASQMGVMCSVLLPQAHVLRAGPGAGRAGFPGR